MQTHQTVSDKCNNKILRNILNSLTKNALPKCAFSEENIITYNIYVQWENICTIGKYYLISRISFDILRFFLLLFNK